MNNEPEQNRSMGKQRTVTDRVHSFDNSYDIAVFPKQIFSMLLPTAYVTLRLYDYRISVAMIMLLPPPRFCSCDNITAYSDKHKNFEFQMSE